MRFLLSDSEEPLIYVSSGKVQTDEKFIHQKRNLDTFVIILCLQGTLYIGQDEYRYTIKENQYILLFADHEHFGYLGNAVTYFWCHFKFKENLNKYQIVNDDELSRLFNIKPPELLSHSSNIPISDNHFSQYYIIPEHGDISSNGRAILIFNQLLDLARKNCYSTRLPNYSLSLLALEISQEFIETHMYKNMQNINLKMEKIIEWIRVNYNNHLTATVDKIAKLFSYNPDYLSTAFRKYCGTPLMKYICMVRVSNAKKLLINSCYANIRNKV